MLEFIGNKLFNFSDSEVDFYLPQLINMYITIHAVAEVIHPYLVARYSFFIMMLSYDQIIVIIYSSTNFFDLPLSHSNMHWLPDR